MLQTFLTDHATEAGMVAYDSPSAKMLSFLSKHYGETALPLLPSWICPPLHTSINVLPGVHPRILEDIVAI